MAAGKPGQPHAQSRDSELNRGRSGTLPLPVATICKKPHPLNLSTAPPPGSQAFKCLSLWGSISHSNHHRSSRRTKNRRYQASCLEFCFPALFYLSLSTFPVTLQIAPFKHCQPHKWGSLVAFPVPWSSPVLLLAILPWGKFSPNPQLPIPQFPVAWHSGSLSFLSKHLL